MIFSGLLPHAKMGIFWVAPQDAHFRAADVRKSVGGLSGTSSYDSGLVDRIVISFSWSSFCLAHATVSAWPGLLLLGGS